MNTSQTIDRSPNGSAVVQYYDPPSRVAPSPAPQIQADVMRAFGSAHHATFFERMAMRVGVALIIWGGRGRPAKDRDEQRRDHEQRVARERRERNFEREMLMTRARW